MGDLPGTQYTAPDHGFMRSADPPPTLGIVPDAILHFVPVKVGQLHGADDRHNAVHGPPRIGPGDKDLWIIGALDTSLQWR